MLSNSHKGSVIHLTAQLAAFRPQTTVVVSEIYIKSTMNLHEQRNSPWKIYDLLCALCTPVKQRSRRLGAGTFNQMRVRWWNSYSKCHLWMWQSSLENQIPTRNQEYSTASLAVYSSSLLPQASSPITIIHQRQNPAGSSLYPKHRHLQDPLASWLA